MGVTPHIISHTLSSEGLYDFRLGAVSRNRFVPRHRNPIRPIRSEIRKKDVYIRIFMI